MAFMPITLEVVAGGLEGEDGDAAPPDARRFLAEVETAHLRAGRSSEGRSRLPATDIGELTITRSRSRSASKSAFVGECAPPST